MRGLLDICIRWSIYAGAGSVPFLFIPVPGVNSELAKLYAFVCLVGFGLLCKAAMAVFLDKRISFSRTPLDIPAGFLAVSAFLSAAFSADVWMSLLGSYGRFSDSVLLIFSCVGYYMLVSRVSEKPMKILRWFLGGAFVALFVSLSSLFDLWSRAPFMSSLFPSGWASIVAETPEAAAVFFAVLFAFLAGRFAWPPKSGFLPEPYVVFGMAGSFVLLLAVRSFEAWVVAICGLGFILLVGLAGRMRSEGAAMPAMRMLLLGGLLTVFVLVLFSGGMRGASEVRGISQGVSWQVAKDTVMQGPKFFLLGSGPGTFSLDFSLHRPPGAYASFEAREMSEPRASAISGANFASETLATGGLLGVFSYGLLAFFFFFAAGFSRSRALLPFAGAVFAGMSSWIMYPQTVSLAVSLWLFLGLGAVSLRVSVTPVVLKFKRMSFASAVSKIGVAFLALGFGILCVFAVRAHLADYAYERASFAMTRGNGADPVPFLESAVALNPYEKEYGLSLAVSYMARAVRGLAGSKEENAPAIRDIQKSLAHVRGDVVDEERIWGVIERHSNSVEAWETLGLLYGNIRSAPGALEWSMQSFERASALEPNNPILRVELGKAYAANNETDKAREQFERALALDPGYAFASRELAMLMEKTGDFEHAKTLLEQLASQNPADGESLFQLGRVLYNQGDADGAAARFRKVLSLFPNHSNALFALAVALEKRGEAAEALDLFEKVLDLNPDSGDARRGVERLQANTH